MSTDQLHSTVHTASKEPQWVEEMREYRSANGVYRSEDIARLLGNPWTCVEIKTSIDGAASASVTP